MAHASDCVIMFRLAGYAESGGNADMEERISEELCKLCLETHNGFGKIADQCSDLTAYGVQTRYPMALTRSRIAPPCA